jgi:hypothetical protein
MQRKVMLKWKRRLSYIHEYNTLLKRVVGYITGLPRILVLLILPSFVYFVLVSPEGGHIMG